jgi:F0F1-type ATP synthase assembly protein I
MPTKTSYNSYLKYSGIGIEIALSGVIPIVLGIYADNYFDSSPWGLLLGLVFGLLGLGVNLYKVVVLMNKNQKKPSDRV